VQETLLMRRAGHLRAAFPQPIAPVIGWCGVVRPVALGLVVARHHPAHLTWSLGVLSATSCLVWRALFGLKECDYHTAVRANLSDRRGESRALSH